MVNVMLNDRKLCIALNILIVVLFGLFLEAMAEGKKSIILLDPAHGGKDKGLALSKDVYEKDITLTVALAIEKEMATDKKIAVVLMRDQDKTMSIEDRRKFVEQIKPEFVISLHVNGGFGKEAAGFEIYYPECGEGVMKGQKAAATGRNSIQKKCQSDSLKMAKIVQENMSNLFPRKGRGLRKADLPITDGMAIPALSVEMGFATNAGDRKKLLNEKTQAEIASALARSIKIFSR